MICLLNSVLLSLLQFRKLCNCRFILFFTSFLKFPYFLAGRCQRESEDQGRAREQQDQDRQAEVQAEVLFEEPGGVGVEEGQVVR